MDDEIFEKIIYCILIGIVIIFAGFLFIFLLLTITKSPNPVIEIQRGKQVEDGYYITINNEVYEYLEG